MKVTATARGYYGGHIREPGDEFEIKSKKDFSKVWMTTDVDISTSEEDEDENKGYHTVHRGRGKWDVFGPDGEVVENGDNLSKRKARALVEKLEEDEEEDEDDD